MSTILDEIKPETAKTLARLAEASGVSIDYLLNRLLSEYGQAPSPVVSPADIDRILDEISEGGNGIAPLPPDFSREDIYSDDN